MGLQYAKRIAYSSEKVLQHTFDMAVKYGTMKPYGIFVEAGVAAGAQIIAMLSGAPGHETWAFDSFQGIPLPSNRDDQMPGISFLTKAEQKALPDPGKQVLKSSGATSVSQMDFMNHVRSCLTYYDYQSLIIFDGWFEEVMPRLKNIQPISILRLDGDLYNSTIIPLKYLYPHLLDGGVCIVDDYGLKGCREAVHDYFGDNLPEMQFIKDENSRVVYWFK